MRIKLIVLFALIANLSISQTVIPLPGFQATLNEFPMVADDTVIIATFLISDYSNQYSGLDLEDREDLVVWRNCQRYEVMEITELYASEITVKLNKSGNKNLRPGVCALLAETSNEKVSHLISGITDSDKQCIDSYYRPRQSQSIEMDSTCCNETIDTIMLDNQGFITIVEAGDTVTLDARRLYQNYSWIWNTNTGDLNVSTRSLDGAVTTITGFLKPRITTVNSTSSGRYIISQPNGEAWETDESTTVSIIDVRNRLRLESVNDTVNRLFIDFNAGLFGYQENNSIDIPLSQGPQGTNGADGAVGPQGIQGVAGNDGADGADGAIGPQGIQGVAGNDGADGADGAVGPQGIQGVAGNDGADGADGAVGPQGIQGVSGNDGADGADGAIGPQGIQGVAGNDGADGADGVGLPDSKWNGTDGSSTAIASRTGNTGFNEANPVYPLIVKEKAGSGNGAGIAYIGTSGSNNGINVKKPTSSNPQSVDIYGPARFWNGSQGNAGFIDASGSYGGAKTLWGHDNNANAQGWVDYSNWDTDKTDDFSGDFLDLFNVPDNIGSNWARNGNSLNYLPGSVAIGTTSTAAKLYVNNDVNGSTAPAIIGKSPRSDSFGKVFQLYNGNSTEVFAVSSDGVVNFKRAIVQDHLANVGLYGYPGGSFNLFKNRTIYENFALYIKPTSDTYRFRISNEGEYYNFQSVYGALSSSSGTNVNSIMALHGDGKVGFNDTTPSYTVDVNGDFRVVDVTGGTATHSAYFDSQKQLIRGPLITQSPALWAQGSGNHIFRNATGGNIGMGTSTPQYLLHLAGGSFYLDGTNVRDKNASTGTFGQKMTPDPSGIGVIWSADLDNQDPTLNGNEISLTGGTTPINITRSIAKINNTNNQSIGAGTTFIDYDVIEIDNGELTPSTTFNRIVSLTGAADPYYHCIANTVVSGDAGARFIIRMEDSGVTVFDSHNELPSDGTMTVSFSTLIGEDINLRLKIVNLTIDGSAQVDNIEQKSSLEVIKL